MRFSSDVTVEQMWSYKHKTDTISGGSMMMMMRYLPEYKVFSDDGLDGVITPNVPV